MSDQRLLDRFVRLCETPSPTGSERAVADALLAELAELAEQVVGDRALRPRRAGCLAEADEAVEQALVAHARRLSMRSQPSR